MVQVVAVLTSIAFIGVIFVVVGFIVFGGGSSGGQGGTADLRSVAQDEIDADPQNPEGWSALAAAELQDGNTEAALEAAQQAAKLDPNDFDLVQTVVQVQVTSGNSAGAVETLRVYTEANPQNPDGFVTLGQIADQSGQTNLARLSYQRYLQLAPDGVLAADVRDRLEGIAEGEPPPAPVPAQSGSGQGGSRPQSDDRPTPWRRASGASWQKCPWAVSSAGIAGYT